MLILKLLAGVLLWLLLAASRHALRVAAAHSAFWERVAALGPSIAAALWTAYGFWIAHSLFSEEPFYPWLLLALILGLVGLLGWFLLRDIAAGTLFAARRQFRLQSTVRVGSLSGKIVRAGLTHIAVKTDQGEVASIPYSRLAGETVSERAADLTSDFYRVRFQAARSEGPEETLARIRRAVICCAWASPRTTPVVHLLGEDEAGYDVEVLFQSLNARQAARVERALRSRFEE